MKTSNSKMRYKQRISVLELKPGMYVSELDRPWLGTPFLMQGLKITSPKQIEQLRNLCSEVYIDLHKTTTRKDNYHIVESEPNSNSQIKMHQPIEEALPLAINAYEHAEQSISKAFKQFKQSKEVCVTEVKKAVSCCVHSILGNESALLWVTQIKNKDNYTWEHSLRVSIMSIALGRELNLSNHQLEELGLAAMLHDIGKTAIPDQILNKQGKLTDEEFEIMKLHTVYGRKALSEMNGVPSYVVDVAYGHHEHVNGQGYPLGLSGDSIPYYAKIVSVIDAYDAITSERVYDTSRSAQEALNILYKSRSKQFDEEIVNTFIKLVGIYPPGHIVELTNGEAGIVLSSTENNKLRPKVMVVRSSEKRLCNERVIDLSKRHKDRFGNPVHIHKVHTDGQFGIRLREYKSQGLNLDFIGIKESA